MSSARPVHTAPLTMSEANQPTDFGAFVTAILARSTSKGTQSIEQKILRQCIGLASSFLVTDITMNSASGAASWAAGFGGLVEVVVALHSRNELELETMNIASKACSECWMVAGSWRGFEECKSTVRNAGGKLKKLLDPNGRTYKGEYVYAP